MTRTKKEARHGRVQVAIWVPTEVSRAIGALAILWNVSRTEAIGRAVLETLAREEARV